MNTIVRRTLSFTATFFAATAPALAHPGHDGHDFTWDFGHLASHPLATLGCSVVLVAGAWAIARLLEAGNERVRAVVRQRWSARRE